MPSFQCSGGLCHSQHYTYGNLIMTIQKNCYYQLFLLLHIGLNHCQSSGILKGTGAISVIARTLIVLNRFLNNLTTLPAPSSIVQKTGSPTTKHTALKSLQSQIFAFFFLCVEINLNGFFLFVLFFIFVALCFKLG